MENKVYVVGIGYDYDGWRILGIYDSYEKAEIEAAFIEEGQEIEKKNSSLYWYLVRLVKTKRAVDCYKVDYWTHILDRAFPPELRHSGDWVSVSEYEVL